MNQANTKNAHHSPQGRWAFLFAAQRGKSRAAAWMLLSLASVLVAAGILFAWSDPSWPFDGAEGLALPAIPHAGANVPVVRRAIDGLPVPSGAPEERPYFAVMIENSVDARPLSGPSKAALVFEAPVEGGITRLLAVFAADADVARIGPVRSARRYFVDWAEELGATFVHVGGSPEALERISRADVTDLNEMARGKYFWRDSKRSAPHNAYTSTDLMKSFAAGAGSDARDALPAWKYSEAPRSGVRPDAVEGVVVDFSTPAYRIEWRYDAATDAYVRYQGGYEQRDADGSLVAAKNVVLLFTQARVIDDLLRLRVATTGSGAAVVATGGIARKGTWSRESLDERTRFYGADGEEAEFAAGTTWIEVVPVGTPVSY